MEYRKPPSFLNCRDPSTDRIYRPTPDKPTILCNLNESESENNFNSKTEESASYNTRSTPATTVSGNPTASSSSASSTAITSACDNKEDSKNVFEEALVYLRLRPVNSSSSKKLFQIVGNKLIVSEKASHNKQVEKHFNFTDIFDDKIEQHIIYERCVFKKVESEENLTILTYGSSGSGKTFTLLGDTENPGIIPRAFEHIFKYYSESIYPSPSVKIDNARLYMLDDDELAEEEFRRNLILSNIDELRKSYESIQTIINRNHKFEKKLITEPMSVLIWISFIEIYNENIYDLLAEHILTETINNSNSSKSRIRNLKRKDYKVVINNGKTYIKNLTSIYVKNSLEAYSVLINGLKRVSYASTQINDHSSLSHFIVFIDIITYTESETLSEISYKFCDLAGSERLSKVGSNHPNPILTVKSKNTRLKETQQINKSLMVLGRCLDATYHNQIRKINEIIPYRESKLTMLLNQALCGQERLTMIVNLMPVDEYFDENLNVLNFSSIAKSIIYLTPKKNKKKSRFSWLMSQQQQEHKHLNSFSSILGNRTQMKHNNLDNYSEAYEKLYEENISLRSQVEELQIGTQELQKQFQHQLLVQEIEIKEKLSTEFRQQQAEVEELWKHTEEILKKFFEFKERHYLKQIEELQKCIESDDDDSTEEGEDDDEDNNLLRQSVEVEESQQETNDVHNDSKEENNSSIEYVEVENKSQQGINDAQDDLIEETISIDSEDDSEKNE